MYSRQVIARLFGGPDEQTNDQSEPATRHCEGHTRVVVMPREAAAGTIVPLELRRRCHQRPRSSVHTFTVWCATP